MALSSCGTLICRRPLLTQLFSCQCCVTASTNSADSMFSSTRAALSKPVLQLSLLRSASSSAPQHCFLPAAVTPSSSTHSSPFRPVLWQCSYQQCWFSFFPPPMRLSSCVYFDTAENGDILCWVALATLHLMDGKVFLAMVWLTSEKLRIARNAISIGNYRLQTSCSWFWVGLSSGDPLYSLVMAA